MQTFLVALIVFAAAAYTVWKLAPARWRNALAARSGTLARAGGASDALARRIEIRAVHAAKAAQGCGGCPSCDGCASAADSAGAPAPGPDRG